MAIQNASKEESIYQSAIWITLLRPRVVQFDHNIHLFFEYNKAPIITKYAVQIFVDSS
jgi:hypothetical protein